MKEAPPEIFSFAGKIENTSQSDAEEPPQTTKTGEDRPRGHTLRTDPLPFSTVAALTALGLSVAAANAALGAALESIARGNMLISRLRHSPPKRWRGA